jgi:hypothetical protein
MRRAFLTTTEAAAAASVTPQCVVRWCRKVPGLGRRVIGRWRVCPAALEAVLTGTPVAGGGDDQHRGR